MTGDSGPAGPRDSHEIVVSRCDRPDRVRIHGIRLVAALEEDRVGRQPLSAAARESLSVAARENLANPDRGGSATEHLIAERDSFVIGYAQLRRHAGVLEMELTALPDRPDAARVLLDAGREAGTTASLWTRGPASVAGRIAAASGLTATREVLLMTRSLSRTSPERAGPPRAIALRPFDPAKDEDAWLRLNRAAFEGLPDQGAWTRQDLRDRLDAAWFDPNGFLVAVDTESATGGIAGFHWTKIDPDTRIEGQVAGEVFVLAVAKAWRGTGLASTLLDGGLSYLAKRGLRRAFLYVERDNRAAVRLYSNAGFAVLDRDQMFTLT